VKTLIGIVGLVLLTNAWMLAHGWWNRTLVRSEFELTEKNCGIHDSGRNGIPKLRCDAGDEGRGRPETHANALRRNGYAILAGTRLTEFARHPGELEDEGRVVVPAQHHPDWGFHLTLPPMTLPPATRVPQHPETFRAKIRIGRNYEPWLVELR
jgi:hypothetical protein